jgi:hypothetical protein
MDKADAAIAAILSKLDALVSAHAAEGIALTLKAMWWNEVTSLVASFAALLAAFLFVRFIPRLWTLGNDPKTGEGSMVLCFFGVAIGGLGAVGSMIVFLAQFFSTHWVTLIDPRMGLALKLIAKVGL